MKRKIIFFVCFLHVTLAFSQKNSSRGMISFFAPVPVVFGATISQERFIKENVSVDFTTKAVYLGVEHGRYLQSVILGVRKYSNSENKIRYWVNPYGVWLFDAYNNQGGGAELDNYHIGIAIGLRRFYENKKVFIDFGLGASCGIGIYRHYQFQYFGAAPDEFGHENVFSWYPRFSLNIGFTY